MVMLATGLFVACNNQTKTDETATTATETTTPDDNAVAADTTNADMNQQAGTEQAGKNVVYTCPMHPEVTSDKPGKCPKCEMTLVVKK
jgi:hypothetical protein